MNKPQLKNMVNFSIINFIKKSLLGILFFIYIYPLKFIFFPFASTRVIIGVFGCLLLLINGLTHNSKNIFIIKKDWWSVFISLAAILSIAIFSNLLNGTKETYFISFPLSMIGIFGATYIVARVVKAIYHHVSFNIIARYIIICVVIQMIITTVMLISPSIKDFALKILAEDYQKEVGIGIDSNIFNSLRIIGFGSQFFAAGVVNCFALILIVILINYKVKRNEKTTFLKIGFALVSIVGTILSRTTLIGIILSIVLLAYKAKISIPKLRSINLLFIVVAFFTYFAYFFSSSMQKDIYNLSKLVTEMFDNYSKITSTSTNQLYSFYEIYPNNFKTWVIGDGYYAKPFDPTGYYMDTDVGYARLIFYFGIIGLLAYLVYQTTLIKIANKITNNEFPLFFFTIFVLLIILNLKGMTDITSLVSLFLFCEPNLKFIKNGQ